MKRLLPVLLLLSLLPPLFSEERPASLLGEEILSDLLDLDIQIASLRQQLESLERSSAERELLLKDLEANRTRREYLLETLSTRADARAAEYGASLRRWKFLTVLFGSLSFALAGALAYQGAVK